MIEKVGISVRNFLQVLLVYLHLGDSRGADAFYHYLDGRLQVDYEVGNGSIFDQHVVNLVVQVQFVLSQGGLGKQAVRLDQEVGNPAGHKQVRLAQSPHLLDVFEQKM